MKSLNNQSIYSLNWLNNSCGFLILLFLRTVPPMFMSSFPHMLHPTNKSISIYPKTGPKASLSHHLFFLSASLVVHFTNQWDHTFSYAGIFMLFICYSALCTWIDFCDALQNLDFTSLHQCSRSFHPKRWNFVNNCINDEISFQNFLDEDAYLFRGFS